MSSTLQRCSVQQLSLLTDKQKLAFYANLYNAFIMHATCVLNNAATNPPTETTTITAKTVAADTVATESQQQAMLPITAPVQGNPGNPLLSPEAIAQRSAFFSGLTGAVYRICNNNKSNGGGAENNCEGQLYIDLTPDIVEHAVLRCNRPHPSQVAEALSSSVSAFASISASVPTTISTATTVEAENGAETETVSAIPLVKETINKTQNDDYFYRTLSYLPLTHPIISNKLHINNAYFDPRIHFVLNCGAKSCPPVKILECTDG